VSFCSWLAAKRFYAQFYLATTMDCMAHATTLAEMKGDGVGCFIVDDDGRMSESTPALNPVLVITPDPNLKYGDCNKEVVAALRNLMKLIERMGCVTSAKLLSEKPKIWHS
jgi:hypothetical protein